jgi:hypothetical protein
MLAPPLAAALKTAADLYSTNKSQELDFLLLMSVCMQIPDFFYKKMKNITMPSFKHQTLLYSYG